MIQYPHVPFKDQFADPNKKKNPFVSDTAQKYQKIQTPEQSLKTP